MNVMCRKCSGMGFFLQQHGMQVGMYCDNCGAWLKWVGKKDIESFKRKGVKVYPQNANITLRQQKNIGVEMVETMDKQEIPFEPNNMNFGVNPTVIPSTNMGVEQSDIDIEAEVERRVAERLATMKNQPKVPEITVDEGFCPVCDGSPLEAEGQSRVEVSIYSGVMTITDPEGFNIYGLYRLKRCPFCGKMF